MKLETESKSTKKTCKLKDCNLPNLCKGFCRKHYTAFFRGQLSLDGSPINYTPRNTPPHCTFGSCDRKVHGSGLCNLHRKWLYKGYIDKNNKILVPEKCRERKVDKCKICGDTKVKAYGFCQSHYRKFRRGIINQAGGVLKIEGPLRHCTVHMCFSKNKISKGLCKKHQGAVKAGLIDNQGNKLREPKRVRSYRDMKCKICDQFARSKGFCRNHFSHLQKGNIDISGKWQKPEPIRNAGKKCSDPECNREAKIKLMCILHYTRSRSGFAGYKNVGHNCSENGCGKPAMARTLCHNHYRILRIIEKQEQENHRQTESSAY